MAWFEVSAVYEPGLPVCVAERDPLEPATTLTAVVVDEIFAAVTLTLRCATTEFRPVTVTIAADEFGLTPVTTMFAPLVVTETLASLDEAEYVGLDVLPICEAATLVCAPATTVTVEDESVTMPGVTVVATTTLVPPPETVMLIEPTVTPVTFIVLPDTATVAIPIELDVAVNVVFPVCETLNDATRPAGTLRVVAVGTMGFGAAGEIVTAPVAVVPPPLTVMVADPAATPVTTMFAPDTATVAFVVSDEVAVKVVFAVCCAANVPVWPATTLIEEGVS
jgi:hypothetical protein